MDVSANMACQSPFLCSQDDGHESSRASGSEMQDPRTARKRRHSVLTRPRRKSIVNHILDGEENLLLKVSSPLLTLSLSLSLERHSLTYLQADLFLAELERRLEFLDSFGELTIDSSITRAYSTLQAVRTGCSHVSEEVLGEGRRRVQVMVETLETRYHEALAAAESLNEKARVGIELLDNMLTEFENHAYKFRERGLANAAGLMDESRRVVDEGLERAREVVDEGLERAKWAAESLEERVQKAVTHAREHGLLRYDQLPDPWRINPHILEGYRFCETKVACVRSMFGISNELVNIWSHGLGLLLVLAVAFYFYPTSVNFHLSTQTDVFIAAVFFFAACQCLICSTIWHTMNSIADAELVSSLICVDYTGISLLVAASIMTTEYTVFYCDPISRWIYIPTTALLGIGGVILPWHPRFNGQDMAWARVAFYVGLGATGCIPMLHVSLTRGPYFVWQFYSPIAKSIAAYLVGAFIYAGQIPERWFPGMFDYFGGSHNLWHMAVLGGIVFHYMAMQEFFSNAFQQAQGGCPVY